jgi:hypothetical protein
MGLVRERKEIFSFRGYITCISQWSLYGSSWETLISSDHLKIGTSLEGMFMICLSSMKSLAILD